MWLIVAFLQVKVIQGARISVAHTFLFEMDERPVISHVQPLNEAKTLPNL